LGAPAFDYLENKKLKKIYSVTLIKQKASFEGCSLHAALYQSHDLVSFLIKYMTPFKNFKKDATPTIFQP
jgi:hypothetical protein